MKFAIISLIITYSVYASSAIIDGIKVRVSEVEKFKDFSAIGSTEIVANLESVREQILSFNNRCNQELKKRRVFLKKEFVCKFHNPSLVESHIIKDIKNKKYIGKPNIIDEFLVWRNVYNRNSYSYYDLILVKKISGGGYEISYQMLNDVEVEFYLEDYKKKSTAFNKAGGVFKLTPSKGGVNLSLSYESETNHWLLTSGFAEKTILEKIASGTRLAIEAVKKGSENK